MEAIFDMASSVTYVERFSSGMEPGSLPGFNEVGRLPGLNEVSSSGIVPGMVLTCSKALGSSRAGLGI